MTSSPGNASAVFDRYRAEGHTLFDPDRLTRLAASADRPADSYDELLEADGAIRPAWADLARIYQLRGPDRLRDSAARLAAAVSDDGVVYNEFDGQHTVTRDWDVDAVPLVIDGVEWAELEKAITQRSMLLDLLLRDLYRDQKTIAAGLVAPEMVFGHPGYIRKAARLEVAGPHALFLHAVDISRTADGRFVAYRDRTQAPSGIGYAIVGRRLMSKTFPQLFQACAPRPMTTFAGTMRLALTEYAPPGVDDPTVAVLSPGSMSETAFDQAYLASVLSFPLVEGADLTVRDGAVYMRSLGRYKRVDVLLRRVDAAYSDPLDLRTDSQLGVAGLVEAISRGTVTVLNTLGSGVLENPALHTVLERLAPVLLDEDLRLGSVTTYWAGDPLQRSLIRDRLDTLVLTNTSTGEEFIGPLLAASDRADLAARIEAQTWQWVARELEAFSVAPTITPGSGPVESIATLRAAPVSVRAFSVAQGPGYAVMPGGLGAVLADGVAGAAHHVVAAKDVWVTSTEVGGHVSRRSETRGEPAGEVVAGTSAGRPVTREYSDVAAAASPRVLADLFWLGRYGERTELVTRLAKVSRERYQDFQYRPWMSGTPAVPLLLHAVATVTGTARYLDTADLLLPGSDRPPSPDQVNEAIEKIADLTVSRSVPGTIAYSVDRLISTVRAVRDQMSTSTWMVLAPVERIMASTTRLVLRSRADAGAGDAALDLGPDLARAHDEILHGVLALTGLQAESMVHDPAWMFMDVGRRIDRAVTLADLTLAMFADAQDTDVEQALLESYLVANESSVIYRRRNRGLYQAASVAELLLFDPTNPRSMIFCLDKMNADLSSVPETLRSAGAERAVQDMIAELRRGDPADLVRVDADRRRPELVELMTTLRTGARELSDLLTRTRFATPRQARPIWAGGES
ncbi:circularly permuted type 2 ATP-grasp protein [Gordonia hongkongensis]|uniref:Circularly permuted type 2 ATP-grasp protein n=1 Tax=Gordonia hongkongensis TaxID=1701090 RepID=A0ABT6BRK0_9ACTN|nr:circularly permuted type 2 ATP-grasp protein [Gordonia hongkongensis]MDF6100553.1 circularly permuted type 2 ATP-grasp protein [Gordonia hongkongensis]